jgi:putative addiction module killer protein
MDYNHSMSNPEREVRVYETTDGRAPLSDWLQSLRDRKGRAIIRTRLARLRLGLFGDAKSVGGDVNELRIQFGPGYRIYYALDGDAVILLLCGGDKKSQDRDIQQAKAFWKDYRSRDDAEES